MFNELDFIVRKNGYLDFDSYLFETYSEVSVKNILLEKEKDGSIFWIEVLGNKYMFKPCTKKEAVKELLAAEMLEYVGYDHAEYDLACINGEYGVITRNLKKDYCSYISGDELIQTYYEYIDADADKQVMQFENRFNNLEDIWNMLEIKYDKHPNKRNMIKNIMNGLCEKFMFDLLTCQWDGAAYNWMIEEQDNYAKLFPIHDNEKMLDGINQAYEFNENIKVEEEIDSHKRTKYNYFKEIKKFLNYSDERFVSEFKNLMNALTPENVRYLFVGIENKIDEKIEFKIKNEILSLYEYMHNALSEILEEELSIKR